MDDVEEVAVATSGQEHGELLEQARRPLRHGGRCLGRPKSAETTPVCPGGRITPIPVFFGAGVTADDVTRR